MKHIFFITLALLIHIKAILADPTATPFIDTIPPIDTGKYSNNISINSTIQPEEFFVDSLHIGKRTQNKIELSKYRTSDSNYVIIKFFAKKNGKWHLVNQFQLEKDGVIGCDPKIEDFTNDGLNDFTYVSAIAARGANEIRKLFIYDKLKGQLIYLKNSDEYPNLLFNKELNCIDAFMVYGGCTTVFLKIKGDKLKEFATVELYEGLTVTTFDSNGKGKVIYRNKKVKDIYIRYKNYKPLKQY